MLLVAGELGGELVDGSLEVARAHHGTCRGEELVAPWKRFAPGELLLVLRNERPSEFWG